MSVPYWQNCVFYILSTALSMLRAFNKHKEEKCHDMLGVIQKKVYENSSNIIYEQAFHLVLQGVLQCKTKNNSVYMLCNSNKS